MLKTKIYASQVGNLSDARYFAAWGVDYIGFVIDSGLSVTSIKEMIDWVEGPEYIMELEGIDSSPETIGAMAGLELSKVMTTPFFGGYLPPSMIHLPSNIFPKVNHADEQIIKIEGSFGSLREDDLSSLRQVCSQNKIWVDVDFSVEDLDYLLNEISPLGLIIRGGVEEKVGLKNFDDLDAIFEHLEVFD